MEVETPKVGGTHRGSLTMDPVRLHPPTPTTTTVSPETSWPVATVTPTGRGTSGAGGRPTVARRGHRQEGTADLLFFVN